MKYAARITQVRHGSFNPFVFSSFGGMSRAYSFFYKKLAEKLAEKRNLSSSETMCFVRTKINFSLIKSLVLCVRGSRSVHNDAVTVADTDIELVNEISGVKV